MMIRPRHISAICMCVMLACAPAHALIIENTLPAAQEKRAQALLYELRCLVCEGQTVADSDALFARQVRQTVREEIQAGKSNEAIKAQLYDTYGAAILLNPPASPLTYAIYALPLLLMLTGVFAFLLLRRKKEVV